MNVDGKCALVGNEAHLVKILKAKNRVIALFYASWCPFCKKFLPVFKKYAEEDRHFFLLVRDDEKSIAEKYSVAVYPTVLFFENEAISRRLDGVPGVGLHEKQLIDFIQSCP